MWKILILRPNIITLHNLLWWNQHQPSICNLPSSKPSKCESFNIPLIISILINRETSTGGMHLTCQSKLDHYLNRWSTWNLPLSADFKLEFLHASSIYGIFSDCISISSHIFSIWYFHQLTNSANRKTSFVWACSIYGMLQRRWSYLVLISSLQSCTFLTDSANLKT